MADKTDAAEPTQEKSKKKLVLIIAVVLMLAAGGAGYLMLGGSSEPAPPKPGKVLAMDSITLNLADGHFLKLTLALQATADASGELDGSKALDLAVAEFSNRKVAELSTAEAREAGKAELRDKVDKAYEGEVMDIYFTEFVMQ